MWSKPAYNNHNKVLFSFCFLRKKKVFCLKRYGEIHLLVILSKMVKVESISV